MIFAQKEDLGFFHDLSGILNQTLSLRGKLSWWIRQGARSEEAVESNVDLFVLRQVDVNRCIDAKDSRGESNLRMGLCHLKMLDDGGQQSHC